MPLPRHARPSCKGLKCIALWAATVPTLSDLKGCHGNVAVRQGLLPLCFIYATSVGTTPVMEMTLLLANYWPWFEEAELVGANFSPGFDEVWMGRPFKVMGDV